MSEAKTKTIQLSSIQQLIGRRMLASKLQKPCFYLEARADVTQLMKMRPKLRKLLGVKITTNSFYIRSLAKAALKFPYVLGTIEADNIRIAETINVGYAVNAPQGLVVPVVKNVQNLSLADIARAEKKLTDKARDNELLLEDIEGETIAISNLGAYDIHSFIGIVPPPISCIMAVGNVVRTVVPIDGEPAERKIVSLNIAADSRVIDPAYAARFLDHIVSLLEDPGLLIED
jgi:pyruvate dehydrogenase E2 component (dihydrolipoamide acetyltransferase)